MRDHPLDNAAATMPTGAHAALLTSRGAALVYRPDVSPFAALPVEPTPEDWADLAESAGPGTEIVLTGSPRVPPADWAVLERIDGVQFDGSTLDVAPDPEAVLLGPDDVPEMLALVARTRPGPFCPGTHLMGTYLGIRRDGALVAMAGERLRPPGWSEISAVCTDGGFRGEGLAGRLVRAVGSAIRDRGEIPFLHTGAENTAAIRLYHHLGFTLRRETTFVALRTPGHRTSVVGAARVS